MVESWLEMGDDDRMLVRALIWAGGILALVTAVGFVVYLAVVGLDQAANLGSVIAAVVELAAFLLAVWGTLLNRRALARSGAKVRDQSSVSRRIENEISGGTQHGPVLMGGDIVFGSPPSATSVPVMPEPGD